MSDRGIEIETYNRKRRSDSNPFCLDIVNGNKKLKYDGESIHLSRAAFPEIGTKLPLSQALIPSGPEGIVNMASEGSKLKKDAKHSHLYHMKHIENSQDQLISSTSQIDFLSNNSSSIKEVKAVKDYRFSIKFLLNSKK
ncbi:hypothetical protein AYI68_g1153 [Smittium mucronatum]|uniref:Uncharacterized protein n=1 Tax=Smittium mucronatum TaxID=133383 RepID=A0A1R0H684_9FUNG|nr:hypothetical protein AYI68_g1153 [Smittium mucronatum]